MYSTYLGGTSFDQAVAIAVNSAGEAYVAGNASSTDFPTTSGAFQTASHGFQDAFVTKFNASGNALAYSTYLGGSATDTANGIAIDGSGNAYVAGITASANFPTTSGAFQTSFGGGAQTGFLTKVNPTGTALAYSTFLGGTSADNMSGVDVDGAGDAYVTGYAISSDFPTTSGALKTTLIGGSDVYVAKFNPAGSALIYSTLIGGPSSSESVWANAIAVDSAGNSYVTGVVQSNDYPVTPGAIQTSQGGANDTFMTELNPTGSALVYSTFLGGSDVDSGNAICVDSSGNVYVAGETASANFPVTTGAFQITNNSPTRGNAFITKFTPPTSVSPGVSLSTTSLTFANQAINTTSAAKSVTLTNNGTADLSVTAVATTGSFAVSGTCISSSPIAPNGTCTENVTFAPATTGTLTGTLSFTDNASSSPQSVALTGTGVLPAPTATTTALTASASSAVVGGSVPLRRR